MKKKFLAISLCIGLGLIMITNDAFAEGNTSEPVQVNDSSKTVSNNFNFELGLKPGQSIEGPFQFDSERRVNLGIVQNADNVAVTEWKIYNKDKKVVYSENLNGNTNAAYTESKILPAGEYTLEVINVNDEEITGNGYIYFNHINDPKDTVSPNLDLNMDGQSGQAFYFQIDTPRMVNFGIVQKGKDFVPETIWYISNEKHEIVYEEKLHTTAEPVYTTPKLLQPGLYEVNIVNESKEEITGNAHVYYLHSQK